MISNQATAAEVCVSLLSRLETVPTYTLEEVESVIGSSKKYQDDRNSTWLDRNKCLCCHTTLPYILGRNLDQKSKNNFDRMKLLADKKIENSNQAPWYNSDNAGRNSNPTEAVLNALTLVSYDVANNSQLSNSTLKSMDRIFENMDSNGKIHWLDYALEPFESKKGELWGNSIAVLAIEMARSHFNYQPNINSYKILKNYVMSKKSQFKPHEKSVLLWANSLNKKNRVLSLQESNNYIKDIVLNQKMDGSWNQSSILGQGKNTSDAYSTSIALIGLISSSKNETTEIKKGVLWLTENIKQISDSNAWTELSMNRPTRSLNNSFATDAATSYASLALKMYNEKFKTR